MTSKVRLSVVLLNAVMRAAFSTVTCVPTAIEALGTAAQISPFEVARRRYVYWLAGKVSSTEPLKTVLSSLAAGSEACITAWRAGCSGRTAVLGVECALNRADPAPAATAMPSTAVMPRLAFRAGERGFTAGGSLPTRKSLRLRAHGDKR